MSIANDMGIKVTNKMNTALAWKQMHPSSLYNPGAPQDFTLPTAVEVKGILPTMRDPGIGQLTAAMTNMIMEMNKPLFTLLDVVREAKKLPDIFTDPKKVKDVAAIGVKITTATSAISAVMPPTPPKIIGVITSPLKESMPAYNITINDPVKIFSMDPAGISVTTAQSIQHTNLLQSQLQRARQENNQGLIVSIERTIAGTANLFSGFIKFLLGMIKIPIDLLVGPNGILTMFYNWLKGIMSDPPGTINAITSFLSNVPIAILNLVSGPIKTICAPIVMGADLIATLVVGLVECVVALMLLPFTLAGLI